MKLNKKNFGEFELKSSVKLYEKTPIIYSLIKVISISVLTSFVTGLYFFVDQILMVRILLSNNNFVNKTLDLIDWNQFVNYYQKNTNLNINLTEFLDKHKTISSIIRVSNSSLNPILLASTAIVMFVSLGSSIIYSKALGTKNKKNIEQIWKNSFYNSIFTSIISIFVLIVLVYFLIPLQISKKSIDYDNQLINNFLFKKQKVTIKYATQYGLIIIIFNFFNIFANFLGMLLNSEGKNLTPTVILVLSNLLNIFLDYILLSYSNLGLNGSAIATAISYTTSFFIIFLYLIWKIKINDTFLNIRLLKLKNDINLKFSIIFLIIAIGFSSFLRNFSASLFYITQQTIYTKITNEITNKDSNYYNDILGAVMPIYNLFFSAIIGIIRGARTVIGYNYGKKDTKKVLKAFWISNFISIFYGFLFYFFIAFIPLFFNELNGGFLWFFRINKNSLLYNDAIKLLNINMSQLVSFSFTISGMLYFQSTSKSLNSILTSIVNSIFIGIPTLFIMSKVSLLTKNIEYFNFSLFINFGLSGILVFCYTIWYIYFKKKKIYFEK